MSGLRRFFGPSKEEIWRQLSAEIDANYVEGSWRKADKVEATHGEWTVTLDTYTVSTGKAVIVFTRMRAPFVNPDGFRFTVYRRSLFSGIAKFFGMQDVEVGEESFDREFIVKSNDESKVRALCLNPRLRELIARQPDIHFTVKDDEGWFGPSFPEGVDELYFSVAGVIKDVERLELLYELFAATLDELCRIGSAYERAPGVRL
jgi:hypothetical protein